MPEQSGQRPPQVETKVVVVVDVEAVVVELLDVLLVEVVLDVVVELELLVLVLVELVVELGSVREVKLLVLVEDVVVLVPVEPVELLVLVELVVVVELGSVREVRLLVLVEDVVVLVPVEPVVLLVVVGLVVVVELGRVREVRLLVLVEDVVVLVPVEPVVLLVVVELVVVVTLMKVREVVLDVLVEPELVAVVDEEVEVDEELVDVLLVDGAAGPVVVVVPVSVEGQLPGGGAFLARNFLGSSLRTVPPKRTQCRRVPVVRVAQMLPCVGSSSVIPMALARTFNRFPCLRIAVRTSDPLPVESRLRNLYTVPAVFRLQPAAGSSNSAHSPDPRLPILRVAPVRMGSSGPLGTGAETLPRATMSSCAPDAR